MGSLSWLFDFICNFIGNDNQFENIFIVGIRVFRWTFLVMLKLHLNLVTGPVDRALAGKAPWQIVAITTSTVLGAIWLWELLSEDESEYLLESVGNRQQL